jgi:hypothetical protein
MESLLKIGVAYSAALVTVNDAEGHAAALALLDEAMAGT